MSTSTRDEMKAAYAALHQQHTLVKTDRDQWFHAYHRLQADRDRLAATNQRLLELHDQAHQRAMEASHESVVIAGHPDADWPRLTPLCRWLHRQRSNGGRLAGLASWVLGRRNS